MDPQEIRKNLRIKVIFIAVCILFTSIGWAGNSFNHRSRANIAKVHPDSWDKPSVDRPEIGDTPAPALIPFREGDRDKKNISEMDPQDAARILAAFNMDAKTAASYLNDLDFEKAAEILTAITDGSIPIAAANLYPNKASLILSAMEADKAVSILEEMNASNSASILVSGSMRAKTAASILTEINPEDAAGILAAPRQSRVLIPSEDGNTIVSQAKAAEILLEMKTADAADVLAGQSMDAKVASKILTAREKFHFSRFFRLGFASSLGHNTIISKDEAAKIISEMKTADAADILAGVNMTSQAAAEILTARKNEDVPHFLAFEPASSHDNDTIVPADKAAEILSEIETADSANILANYNIDAKSAAFILDKMSPELANQILTAREKPHSFLEKPNTIVSASRAAKILSAMSLF